MKTAAGLLVGAGTLLLAGCEAQSPAPAPLTVSDQYRWDDIQTDQAGRRYYYPDGHLSSRLGIDVSDHNGAIDWHRVVQDGIQFAIIRIGRRGYTQGGLYLDERMEENLAGAVAAGLPFGAYFFSSAVSEAEAVEEARFTLDALGSYRPIYPIVYDQEQVPDPSGRANSLTRAQYTANAKAFCETVEAAGYKPMIYGNQHHLALLDLDDLAWDVWYAEYGVTRPTSLFEFSMWQYSDSATVAGIEGSVDMNLQFIADAS